MRGAVTKKDSLDSFVPPVWSVCHLSGAVLGLTFGEDELVTRAALLLFVNFACGSPEWLSFPYSYPSSVRDPVCSAI